MNAVVLRYTRGKSLEERIRIHAVWTRIEKKYMDEDDVRGLLPCFGRTAVAFIREMENRGRIDRKGDAPITAAFPTKSRAETSPNIQPNGV